MVPHWTTCETASWSSLTNEGPGHGPTRPLHAPKTMVLSGGGQLAQALSVLFLLALILFYFFYCCYQDIPSLNKILIIKKKLENNSNHQTSRR